jgi:hypothetical protein
MGMSTHVVGFRPADDEWYRKTAAYRACADAGVAIPAELETFFGGEDPLDQPGYEVNIKAAVSPYSADSRSGYDIDLSKLPPGLKIVRVYNSY